MYRQPHPSRGDRLLALAAEVGLLGYGGCPDSEDSVVTELSVPLELRALAREMDRP
jgi:hypothetical protein